MMAHEGWCTAVLGRGGETGACNCQRHDMHRGLAEMEGIWKGVDFSERDIDEAKFRLTTGTLALILGEEILDGDVCEVVPASGAPDNYQRLRVRVRRGEEVQDVPGWLDVPVARLDDITGSMPVVIKAMEE